MGGTHKKIPHQVWKGKSQVLTIGTREVETRFNLGDTELENTNTYKYLGMTINNMGNLEDHISKIKGKQRQHAK